MKKKYSERVNREETFLREKRSWIAIYFIQKFASCITFIEISEEYSMLLLLLVMAIVSHETWMNSFKLKMEEVIKDLKYFIFLVIKMALFSLLNWHFQLRKLSYKFFNITFFSYDEVKRLRVEDILTLYFVSETINVYLSHEVTNQFYKWFISIIISWNSRYFLSIPINVSQVNAFRFIFTLYLLKRKISSAINYY